MNKPIKAILLAAGKGKRLCSAENDAPKVMRLAAGKPLIGHVLDALSFISKEDFVLVVGYKKEQVMEAFPDYSFAVQKEQLGTGHAAACGMEMIPDFHGDVLIAAGDMPLLKEETYRAMVDIHRSEGNDCTILTGPAAVSSKGYGRVIRDANGCFCEIVEDKDCTEDQAAITELNTATYVFNADALRDALSHIKNNNAQGEYYLTDAPAILMTLGYKVDTCKRELGREILGVNTQEQLDEVDRILTARKLFLNK